LTCTLTVKAGSVTWYTKAVALDNIDGGVNAVKYETFHNNGGLNSASATTNDAANTATSST
jgi:hypothetical protein